MTVKIKVEGKVQGVYYRASTRNKARSMGLTGYVINVSDGSVSIIVCGEEDKINDLLKWCKTGVDLARVDTIEYTRIEDKQFNTFEIKR